jgi:acyltransferase
MNKINRVHWVDTAKAIGIALVFYGHLIEAYAYPWTTTTIAFKQFKFIYSFHVPLFFYMAGFFWKKKTATITQEVKRLLLLRITAVILFSLLLLPFWFLWAQNDEARLLILKHNIVSYIWGLPGLNWLTWFLVCLFVVELIAFCVLPRLSSKPAVYLGAFIFIFTGIFVCDHCDLFLGLAGIPKNAWFILVALVPFGFYALGYASFQNISVFARLHVLIRVALAGIFVTMTLITYNLNTPKKFFIMFLCDPFYGNSLFFIFTSLMGIFFVITIATIVPYNSIIQYIGQNTLMLLGLNGLFYHFINSWIVSNFRPAKTILSVTSYCCVATVLSLAFCLLLIILFNRFMHWPQRISARFFK